MSKTRRSLKIAVACIVIFVFYLIVSILPICNSVHQKMIEVAKNKLNISLKYHDARDMRRDRIKSFVHDTKSSPFSNKYQDLKQNTKCYIWGVTTTIFNPAPSTHQLMHEKQICLVVVGDKKTNLTPWRQFEEKYPHRAFYLSVGDQLNLPLTTIDTLPWNHFGRKNIGYLFAMANGATMIYDFDDDNSLRIESSMFQTITNGVLGNIPIGTRVHHLYNPYPNFDAVNTQGDTEFIWPRGFPLNFIQDSNTSIFLPEKSIDSGDVCIFQSLANNNPDVDAIYRLTRKLPVNFQRENYIQAIPKGTYSPWNSQSLLVRDVAFWGLLLPISVDGRVSDIWRSYITSRMLFETPYKIAFTSPFVNQFRNPHDYQEDFVNELDLYVKTNTMLAILSKFSIQRSLNFADNLVFLIDTLWKHDIVKSTDTRLVRAWVSDLNSLNYVWPELQNAFLPFTPPVGPIFDFRRSSIHSKKKEPTTQLIQSQLLQSETNDATRLPMHSFEYDVVFLGDSNMKRLVTRYIAMQKFSCQQNLNRCDYDQYFLSLQNTNRRNSSWIKPRYGIEGPVFYGLAHPGCSDCSGCNSIECTSLQSTSKTKLSYIPIEFARDVMLQSTQHNFNSTQEVISEYLKHRPAKWCVVNSGLHDMLIPGISDAQYIENVIYYLNNLKNCFRITWLHTSSVGSGNSLFGPTTNTRIKSWNGLLRKNDSFLKIVHSQIDLYNVSLKAKRDGPTHFGREYYDYIASILYKDAPILYKDASILYKDAPILYKDASILYKDASILNMNTNVWPMQT